MSDKHLSAEELIAQDSGARLPDGIMAQIIASLALLAFLAYPAFKRSPRNRVPLVDIALGLVAAASAARLGITPWYFDHC